MEEVENPSPPTGGVPATGGGGGQHFKAIENLSYLKKIQKKIKE